MTRKPKFYFSFHSPYSWMASKLLEERIPGVHRELEWVPFFEPDAQTERTLAERDLSMHYASMTKAKHLYILQDTKRIAGRLGFAMHWPVDVDPWWVMPHHAWLGARRNGDEHELYWALLEARWERGEDITTRDAVEKVANSIGLDGAALAAAPEDPQLREEGIAAIRSSWHDDVFGVPYFKVGPHRFWGLDRLDDFVALMRERLGREAPASGEAPASSFVRPMPLVTDAAADPVQGIPVALLERVGSYDRDTAGGCG